MEAVTTWTEVTHSFPRFNQRLWVSQVGGNGSSCGGASGPESSSGTAEVLATTTIPGNDGDISLMAFRPSTIRWQQLVAEEGAESGQLLAWHPWSGERMDLSLSQYADDTTKQIVAEPGEDVQALAKRVRCSNDVFDRALADDGFFTESRQRGTGWDWLLGRSTVGARGASVAARQGRRSGEAPRQSHGGQGIFHSWASQAASSHNGGFLLSRSVVV